MRDYEVVFISTPVLSNEAYKKTVKKYVDFITENGEVTHQEDWGLRQLAYPIEKKTTGFYTLLQFKLEQEQVKKLEIEFKRDENIMRYLTVKLEKYAFDYAETRRNKNSNKSEKQKEA